MNSHPLVLSWAMLRRGWSTLLSMQLVAILIPWFLLSVLQPLHANIDELLLNMHFFLNCIGVWIIVVGVLSAEGPPQQFFTLPIASNSLAVWALVRGAVLSFVMCALTSVIINGRFGASLPVLTTALFAATVYVCLQASTWTAWGSQWRQVLLGGGVSALLLFVLRTRYGIDWDELGSSSLLELDHYWSTLTAGDLGVLGTLMLLFSAIGIFSFRVLRQGNVPTGWLSREGRISEIADVSAPMRALRPFSSARSAQFWFEWRERGWIIPVCYFSVVLIWLGFEAIAFAYAQVRGVPHDSDPRALAERSGLLVGGLAIICIASPIRIGRCRSWNKDLSCGTFYGTRPLSNRRLANSILLNLAVAVLGVAIATGIISGGLLLADGVDRVWSSFTSDQVESVLIVALICSCYVGAAWALVCNISALFLTGRIGYAATVLIGFSLWLFVAMSASMWASPAALRAFGMSQQILFGVVFTLLTVALFRLACRQHMMSVKTLLACTAAWALLVAAFVWLPGTLDVPTGVLLIGCAGLFVLPVASVPLALGTNRYR